MGLTTDGPRSTCPPAGLPAALCKPRPATNGSGSGLSKLTCRVPTFTAARGVKAAGPAKLPRPALPAAGAAAAKPKAAPKKKAAGSDGNAAAARPAKKPKPAVQLQAAVQLVASAGQQDDDDFEAPALARQSAVPSAMASTCPKSAAATAPAAITGVATSAAPAARKRTKAADLDAAEVQQKVQQKFAAGRVSDLSVEEMKCFLKSRKQLVGGKKVELEARVLALSQQQAS